MARASEAEDSRRKHHRSTSDEESLDRSKRHKHRRRHQDCKSMESGDGETEHIDEGENGKAGEMFKVIVSSANSKPAVYDMEEGEIIEDDVLSEIGAKKLGSGVESVEFDAVGTPRGVKFSDTVVKIGERNSDTSMNRKEHSRDVLPTQKNVVTGNVDYGRSYKGYKDDATEVDRGNLADPSLSYTHGNEPGEHNRGSHSPNCGPNGIHRRKRSSRSVDVSETKFHSRRIRYEEGSRKNHNHTDVYGDVKADHVSDDERTYLPSGDRRCDGRDLVGDEKRERRSTDRHRYSWGEDNNHDRGSWDTGREKIFGDGKEKDRRDRTIGEGRKREGSHGREREKKTEHDRKEDKARESSRGTAYDRVYEYRERERERGRNRVSDLEWVRRKDSSRSSYRDRNMDRDLDERDREKKRDSVIDGHSRTRDSRNDRYGDKYRGLESDNGRLSRYDYDDDRYVDQRRASDSRHIMCEPAYDRGNHRKHDAGKDHNAMEESLKECAVEVDRGKNGDEVSENMELEAFDQEEEDINRIKEESRRRREAILQKYRIRLLQNQDESLSNKNENDSAQEKPVDKADDQEHNDSDQSFTVEKSPAQYEESEVENGSGAYGLGEGTPKSERSNDMFCDDIFGDSPAVVRKMGKGNGDFVVRSGVHDNWDDPEGYYSYRLGELLDGRYEISAAQGKGVFSTVVRAKNLKAGSGDPKEVAVKIIRNNDTMLKAGMEELVILKKLVGADPDDRRHCVRFLSSFKYRNHLCLVFESLHMNLREVLKKFGRNIGLKLTAVRAYSKQLFIALKHLRNCGVLHCDIKPDNMLVNDAKNVLKLCDFGNAMLAGKNEITPYLVSRFYRSPEIILGLQYDFPLDMWSVGCCLYELYAGKVLFPGATNNDMLRLHMELKGHFPKKMLRKGAFIDQHFDQDLNFLATEEDPVTKKMIRKKMVNIKPKDIGMFIKGSPGEDPKMLGNFKDLLDKIFVLDPDKRLTVSQALSHPFITGK